jgi:hypothetical protein
MSQNEHPDHEHEHGEETYGMALGFRIIEDGGELFLAEAEIAPYVDSPEELGVTLVFHPLAGINPVENNEHEDWPTWTVDIDDELNRNASGSLTDQFQEIIRQLHGLPEAELREYMRAAKDVEAGG